jgi:branched-chain amino acid transport system permease protein
VAILVVMVGIASFLRFTDYGVAIRAAAENGDRANLLGIPVPRLATMVWALAALLSALGAILRVPLLGFASFASVSGAGNAMLLRTLAAAVIGRMENLPRTVLAALGIGVFERVAIWNLPRTTVVDAMLVVVILAALLAQRDFFARVAETGISSWKAIREVRPVPSELRAIPEVRWAFRGLKVALLAFALLFPVFAQPNQDMALTEVLIYSIVAASLLILTGWAGHISLGQFALVGFGGATTAILYGRHHWDFFFAFIAGVIASSLVALVIGLPALRVRGPFLAVTTLAFAVTSSTYFLEDRYFPWFIQSDISRPKLWGRLPLDHPWQLYLFALAMFGLVMFGVRNLRSSHAGRVLIATRDNELASEAVTLNVTRLKLSAFLISGAIAGVAGGIYVLYQNGINTDSYGADVSIRLFSRVVIGGLGSLPGVVLGAVYVWGVQFFLPPAYALLASGAGILLLLIFLPEGLGGLVYTVRDNYLRWVANRHGILVPSLVADRRVEEAEEQQASVAIGTALAGLRADGAEVVADVIGAAPPDAPPVEVRGTGHRELAGRGA